MAARSSTSRAGNSSRRRSGASSGSATEPPAGTPLYRANGAFAGWIGPDSARPSNVHSITVPQVFQPGAGDSSSRFGDISEATGRPKTVYVSGYTRGDGTYVRSHWRSPPGYPTRSSYAKRYSAPGVVENGSYYREISTHNGLPKTNYVNGYYRRDGTYVRGHYRSR